MDAKNTIEANGIRISVPPGWRSRSLWLDPAGSRRVMEIANFDFSPQSDDDPPLELRVGEPDRITIMNGSDILVCIVPTEESAVDSDATLEISTSHFADASSPRRPRGRALAERTFALGSRRFDLSVTFGREAPTVATVDVVNGILSTLEIAR